MSRNVAITRKKKKLTGQANNIYIYIYIYIHIYIHIHT